MADINMMNIEIGKIPAILWGNPSDKVYLYVHGKAGCKEEAEILAQIVCMRGWQVISFDLPEHGQRKSERNSFNPWTAVPEIKAVYQYAKKNWSRICLYANSLGGMVFHAGAGRGEVGKMPICCSRFGYEKINRKYDGLGKCDIGTAGTGAGDCY